MAQAIPMAIMAAGAGLKAGGSIISANAEARELRNQAAQMDANAGLERASSQRKAMDERRNARIVASRGRALAAASGGGVDDPSVVNLLADIEGEGEYRALSAMYEGETAAQSLEAQAAANRRGAKAAKTAGMLNAAGSIIGAGSSIYDRYGKK